MDRNRISPPFCISASLALLLAGCVAAPDAGPKPELRSAQSVAAGQSLPADSEALWPEDGWWRDLGDPQLTALVEEGLEGSPDVAIAAARYRMARGMVLEAWGDLLPSLDVDGSAGVERRSLNIGFGEGIKQFLPRGWRETGEVTGNLELELDIWGRNRAALAAATSEAEAAQIEARQARLILSTAIALSYFELARLFDEQDVRSAALDIRTASEKLVGDRMKNGLETRGSLRQAQAEVATARSSLVAAQQAVALRRNQIAAMLGAGPDRGLSIERPALRDDPPRGLPGDVTTELVGRRPDIAAARARAQAAASRIKVAHADFFPAIRLGALIGVQSQGLDRLFKSDSVFGSAGPAVSLPIFRGGELRGRYRYARGSYDEAVAEYERAVLDAYREVADIVTGQTLVGQRLVDARIALEASEEAYSIARLRYEGGLSSYLDVLAVEDRLLQARLAVASLDAEARALEIELIRALGGGYGGDEFGKDRSNG
ncbi:MAG: efflux transporter outer membrane subunit [Novosphingobium sp.]|nr:efflux transporter outer membrane subunit [Novosphingobium sp.]MCP5401389.1 efflux transporter outer membrane subunit [Novosphingobium sp.]